MIQVAELVSRVLVTRSIPDAPEPPSEDMAIAPAPPSGAPAPRVDPRYIADLVYRMMRDDLAILKERS
jgi:hypothetical protein